jgi:hypothetical protein
MSANIEQHSLAEPIRITLACFGEFYDFVQIALLSARSAFALPRPLLVASEY